MFSINFQILNEKKRKYSLKEKPYIMYQKIEKEKKLIHHFLNPKIKNPLFLT